MPTYKYQGRSQTGEEVKGQLRAVSPEAVVVYLSERNIIPVIIELTEENPFSLKDLAKMEIRIGSITRGELAGFSRNMSTMLDAGVPIIKALQELAKSSKNPKLKKALFTIIDSVQDGESLAASMGNFSDIFSTLCVSTIEIGENTGNLVEAFSKFSEYLEMEEQNARQLSSALRYPKMVFFAMGIALFVINIMVIPSFQKLFSSMKADLPWATRVLMATSHFITNYWYTVFFIFAALYFGVKTALKNPSVRYTWDRLKLSVPVLGPLFKKIFLTRIVWSLALIIRSGIPILKSIDLVARSTENAFLRQKIEDIKMKVETGKNFADAAEETQIFDHVTMQMLMIAEESGKLDDVLEKIASEYEKETEYQLKKLGDSIEPIMLLILGGMVAVLALAIFSPMWDMGKHAIK
jgi:MSHA biogenesis protein MshG